MQTQEERTMAMLAHGSAVLNVFTVVGGIIVALVIYLVEKDKSPWAAFQALQALVYQVIASVVVWLAMIFSSILIAFLIGCVLLPLSLLLGLAALAYSVYAAYQTYQGLDFRYALVGDWLSQQAPPPPPRS